MVVEVVLVEVVVLVVLLVAAFSAMPGEIPRDTARHGRSREVRKCGRAEQRKCGYAKVQKCRSAEVWRYRCLEVQKTQIRGKWKESSNLKSSLQTNVVQKPPDKDWHKHGENSTSWRINRENILQLQTRNSK